MPEQVHSIPISQIDADFEWNSRKGITTESVSSLALSITEHGLEIPVVVRETGDRYSLVSGFRRFMACTLNNMESMPAFVRELTEYEAKVANWRENGEREQLSLWDEIMFIQDVFPEESTMSDIQKALTKTYDWVRPRRQIWNLPKIIIDLTEQGVYSGKNINELLKRAPVQQEVAAKEALAAQQRGESPKGIRKGSMTRRHVQGRKNMNMMMNIVEQQSLSSDPRIHDLLLWASGDLTVKELAGRLKVDVNVFKNIEE